MDLIHYENADLATFLGHSSKPLRSATILHKAEFGGQADFVDMYLRYLCHVEEDTSLKFHKLMNNLIHYPSFNMYMESLGKCTPQMQDKKIMRLLPAQCMGFSGEGILG